MSVGHQVDPLVTRGGAEVVWGGADGGLRALEEFEVAAPWAPFPAGTVAVDTVLEPAWCPGNALAT